MKTIGSLTRKHEFDASHRVMFEKVKCFNLHGHRYVMELTLTYDELHSIGYAIDFKEIKRVCFSFIDRYFDHGHISNPHDADVIESVRKIGTKLHLMNLMGEGQFCNPSAENIGKELFYACKKLLDNPDNCNLEVTELKLYETPNCWVTVTDKSLSLSDVDNLEASSFARTLEQWRADLGSFEYDSRKSDSNEGVDKIDN